MTVHQATEDKYFASSPIAFDRQQRHSTISVNLEEGKAKIITNAYPRGRTFARLTGPEIDELIRDLAQIRFRITEATGRAMSTPLVPIPATPTTRATKVEEAH